MDSIFNLDYNFVESEKVNMKKNMLKNKANVMLLKRLIGQFKTSNVEYEIIKYDLKCVKFQMKRMRYRMSQLIKDLNDQEEEQEMMYYRTYINEKNCNPCECTYCYPNQY